MKKSKWRVVDGYMTLEAAFVFMTALSVIIFVLFCGLYQYERCVLELDTYYEVQRSLQLGLSQQEYVQLEANGARAQREKAQPFWIGVQEISSMTIRAEGEMKQLKPSYVLRLSQRIKRMKDERDSEN